MTTDYVAVSRGTLMRITGMLGVFEPDNAGITPLIDELLIAMATAVLTPHIIVTDNPAEITPEYGTLVSVRSTTIPEGPLYSINEQQIHQMQTPLPCDHPHVQKLWTGMSYSYTCGRSTCSADIDPCHACDSGYSLRSTCLVCKGVRTTKTTDPDLT